LRVAYFGTSDFAADVLRGLGKQVAGGRWQLEFALVVTPPDRPKGRNRRLTSPPAAGAARELGIEVLQTANVNDEASRMAIAAANPDRGLVCAFGQIIREPLLSDVELWNIHPSLLPRWRGAAPIERALMAGDEESGVSIARVTAGLDSGPIALQERIAIEASDDRGTLGERLAALAVELGASAIQRLARGDLPTLEQSEESATYAEKIDPAERRLDPARPAVELQRIVRALTPHIGAYLELEGGERLGVARAEAEAAELAPATLSGEGGELRLGCASGVLRLARVKPPGGREMEAAEYLRGHPLPRVASA
jgi:methionyl-tRNA formyltransferase